jgi:hypothetical protein
MSVDFAAPNGGFAGTSFPASQVNGHELIRASTHCMAVRGTTAFPDC